VQFRFPTIKCPAISKMSTQAGLDNSMRREDIADDTRIVVAIRNNLTSRFREDAAQVKPFSPISPQASSSIIDSLKNKFLDRFAEFAAREGGAARIACAAMQESANRKKVTIWLSLNGGIPDSDSKQLSDSMEHLSEYANAIEISMFGPIFFLTIWLY
jgi:hypothetical protein